MDADDMLVFGGSGSPHLTRHLRHLGVEPGMGEVLRFPTATCSSASRKSAGAHVYLVQSTAFPANDKFMELLFWIDAFSPAPPR